MFNSTIKFHRIKLKDLLLHCLLFSVQHTYLVEKRNYQTILSRIILSFIHNEGEFRDIRIYK